MIAPGAEVIVKARQRGYKPSEMVLVSLVGKLHTDSPVVLPKAGQAYDWRWVRDLDIGIFINGDSDWRLLASAMKMDMPHYLCLWDVASRRGTQVLWKPIGPIGSANQAGAFVKNGWLWVLDFCNFNEEDNKVFWQ